MKKYFGIECDQNYDFEWEEKQNDKLYIEYVDESSVFPRWKDGIKDHKIVVSDPDNIVSKGSDFYAIVSRILEPYLIPVISTDLANTLGSDFNDSFWNMPLILNGTESSDYLCIKEKPHIRREFGNENYSNMNLPIHSSLMHELILEESVYNKIKNHKFTNSKWVSIT